MKSPTVLPAKVPARTSFQQARKAGSYPTGLLIQHIMHLSRPRPGGKYTVFNCGIPQLATCHHHFS
jgi:hypothetical protein